MDTKKICTLKEVYEIMGELLLLKVYSHWKVIKQK